MRRRKFIALLAGAAAWPLAVRAQQAIMMNAALPAAARVQAARLLIAARDQAQAEAKQPVKNKAEARPSKKAAAARAAVTAGGGAWGDDLTWQGGGQQH